MKRAIDWRFLEHLRTPRLLASLSVVSAVSLAADALSPWLMQRAPALLVIASPRSMYVVAVAHRVPVLFLLPLVTLRLCITDPVHFELGRRLPVAPKSWGKLARVGRRARVFVDSVPALGWFVAVAAWPVSHTLMAAGAGGASRKRIALADITGTLLRVAVMCFVLARFDSAVSAAHVVSNVGPLAAVSFLTYTTFAIVMRRRSRQQADSWDDVANQVEALRLEERVFAAYGLTWSEPAPRAALPMPPHLQASASSEAADA